MTTANHALTGALIAVTIDQPYLVLPLAFASHFLLDALPHWGVDDDTKTPKQKFYAHLRYEGIGLIGILTLLLSGVYGWNIVLLASFVAVLPDIEWPVRYLFYARVDKQPPSTVSARMHKRIQWCERSWGGYVEIAYFALGYLLLIHLST